MVDIEKFENLPYRESRSQMVISKYGSLWNCSKWDRSWKRKEWIYVIKNRILHSSINKPFNDAFSKFCKLVPKHAQYIFLDEFRDYTYRARRFQEWSIDDNGLIQYNPYKWKSKITPYVRSWDYKSEWVYNVPQFKRIIARNPRYDGYNKIIQGWELYFESKNSYYKRIFQDQLKKKKAHKRKESKLKKEQDLIVLHNIIKDRKKKERELNLQKIISHGFDPITSFRPFR